MLKRIAIALAPTATFAVCEEAEAAFCFNESISYVIVSGDDIYFTTDKSCPDWCKVNASWSADAKKRAYAALLAAKMADRTISFAFSELTSTCAGPVPTYASPTHILSE
jgi:hypothetical protein